MSGSPSTLPLRAAVFASGGGSNFQALLDHEVGAGRTGRWRTTLLISDREGCGALERAEQAGTETRVIQVGGRDPDVVAEHTVAALEEASIDVIFLAGYLRLVPAAVVRRWRRRILNIHPALLPSFGGPGMWGHHVHEAVLAAGARITGPTVHFVDEAYDEGTILAQWPVPVRVGDTAARLAARVLEAEHMLYPQAAEHLCRALALGTEPLPLDPVHPHFMSSDRPGASFLPNPAPPSDPNTAAPP